MTSIEEFPDVKFATDDGLLALGGDLNSERLLSAYRKGIFPWYNPGEPILWWSPNPRCILRPDDFKLTRSLKKSIRKNEFTFTIDNSFEEVIYHCATPKENRPGTWITTDMKSAYINLHELGYAHSIETWSDNKLVGGLYGISLGGIFFGESMFSEISDASKAALYGLVSCLKLWGFSLIDCQITSAHLLSLGAMEIPRTEFIDQLECALTKPGKPGNWKNLPINLGLSTKNQDS